MFPMSFAYQLGLDPLTNRPSPSYGVGGTNIPTFFWPITIDLNGLTLDVYAGFSEGFESVGMGMLGQVGFFDRAKVTFDYRNGTFDLEF